MGSVDDQERSPDQPEDDDRPKARDGYGAAARRLAWTTSIEHHKSRKAFIVGGIVVVIVIAIIDVAYAFNTHTSIISDFFSFSISPA
jgi:hypothetical protein